MRGSDDRGVSGQAPRAGASLLEVYDRALPQVYGYLMSRCGERSVAEDLTSETFLAATRQTSNGPVSIGWLIGVARHKLADHWRRKAREERLVRAVASTTGRARILGRPISTWCEPTSSSTASLPSTARH